MKCIRRRKIKFEETNQALESDMARMLELSGQEFKAIMINMRGDLMAKVDSLQKHRSN